MIKYIFKLICIASFALPAYIASASEVEIVAVQAECNPKNSCIFQVSLKHNDSGWDHYANGWQVMLPSGEVLVKRVLFHPHVNEQPFTRSSKSVFIKADITELIIRAADNVSGLNSKEFKLKNFRD